MEQQRIRQQGFLLAVITAPAAWITLFFVIPLSVIWAYSFGRTLGLTEVAVTGTLSNYVRVFDPVYLLIFAKSLVFAGLTTAVCLVIGFPYALAMTLPLTGARSCCCSASCCRSGPTCWSAPMR
jgi:spermidine/putrescine transport system permease protein